MYQPLDFTKEVDTVVTYDDLFTFVTMLCAVVTLIVTLMKRKK